MSRIFISHSIKNNAQAIAIREWLASKGWDDVFLDLDPHRGLKPGDIWQAKLREATERCELVIFLVSPAWCASKWCLAEFLLAKQMHKKIFGILIEPTPFQDIPTEMTNDWQLVDLSVGFQDYETTVTLPPGDQTATVKFGSDGLERLRLGLMVSGLDPRFFAWPPEHDPKRAPYRGLLPLSEDDAGVFFGREGPTLVALDLLRGLRDSPPPRLFVILGASGAGKSSFMRAGLMPRLAREDRHFLPLPIIRPERAVITGDTGLLVCLQQAFKEKDATRAPADLHRAIGSLQAARELLSEFAGTKRQAHSEPPDDGVRQTLIFPIDQAEELFLPEGAEESAEFLKLLSGLVHADEPALTVIFTIRSDSYERLQTTPYFEGIRQHTFSLAPMPQGNYETVIRGPAERYQEINRSFSLDDRLVEAILSDVESGGAKDALPLLAFSLERLFRDNEGGGKLTLQHYDNLGRMKGSIEAAVGAALKAADSIHSVPKSEHDRLHLIRRGMIPWLAGIDPETKSPRRRVAKLVDIPNSSRPLIDLLVQQRLLSTDRSSETGEITLEPAHEALLRQWGMLSRWLEEDLEDLSVAEGVRRAAADWDTNKRVPEWLIHTAGRLDTAEKVAARSDFENFFQALEIAYLKVARQAEEHRRSEETQRQQAVEEAKRASQLDQKQARRNLLVIALISLPIGLILSEVGQLRETYIDLIGGLRLWWLTKEAWTFAHTLYACMSLLLLSIIIYFWTASLLSVKSVKLFELAVSIPWHRDHKWALEDRGFSLSVPRVSLALLAATLPWIGLLSGVAQAVKTAREHIQNIIGSQGNLSGEDDTGANFYFGGTLEVPNVSLTELQDIYDWIDPLSQSLDYVTPVIWPWYKVSLFWQLLGLWILCAAAIGLFMQILVEAMASLGNARNTRYEAATVKSLDQHAWDWSSFQNWISRFRSAALQQIEKSVYSVMIYLIIVLVVLNFAAPPVAEFFGRPGPRDDDALALAQRLELVLPHSWAAWVVIFWPGWTPIHANLPLVMDLPSPIAVWWVSMWVLFLVLAAFNFFATFRPFHGRLRLELRALLLLVRVLAIAAFCLTALSGFMEFYWVDISRAFGPLATVIIVGALLLAAVAGMSHLARHTEIPFFAVVAVPSFVVLVNEFVIGLSLAWISLVLTVVGIMYLIMRLRMVAWVTLAVAAAAMFGAWKHTTNGTSQQRQPTEQLAAMQRDDLKPLAVAFDDWLKVRRPEAFRQRYGRQYPVFIVAAEGGGIYAASAAATFLARMQDTCANFAQHLFAVSGVSGGAVGATIFHGAVSARQKELAEEGCARRPDSRQAKLFRRPLLQDQVAWVLRQDHLSPIVGLIVPDIVGLYSDRAHGLEDSLKLWMNRFLEPVGPWNRPYLEHWNVGKPAPALVLNTTWVRVGNRVVFAPFNIDRPEFVTLNTFDELARKWKWNGKPSLMGATVASARIPGMFPALEMRNSEEKRWHFVDGGYVDASGAITAREIYETIKTSPRIGEIDLRVILLSSTQDKLNDQDTDRAEPASPVATLFAVRSRLSRLAVMETINKLSAANSPNEMTAVDAISNLEHPSQKGDPYLEKGEPWPVSIIELNYEDFRLELGWKISKLTNDVVSLQLGQPELCDLARARDAWQPRSTLLTRVPERRNDEKVADAKRIAKTIRANSCVMRAMVKLLRGEAD